MLIMDAENQLFVPANHREKAANCLYYSRDLCMQVKYGQSTVQYIANWAQHASKQVIYQLRGKKHVYKRTCVLASWDPQQFFFFFHSYGAVNIVTMLVLHIMNVQFLVT